MPVLLALWDLRAERAIGASMGGAIPWRAIIAWAHEYGVADRESFVELVQHADGVTMAASDGRDKRAHSHGAKSAGNALARGVSTVPTRRLATGHRGGARMGAAKNGA
jgi:hypothetical protein